MPRSWMIPCIFLLVGCTCPPQSLSAPYVRVVLFKIKSGERDRMAQEVLEDARDLLVPIPNVRGLWAGRPVPRAPSPDVAIDSDYDIAVLMVFNGPRDVQGYLDHPALEVFREKYAAILDTRVVEFSPYAGPPRT